RQRVLAAAEAPDEVEAAPDRAQHAETENIDLQQAEILEIVLLPLDDRAIFHGGILDRDQFRQGTSGNDEAAHVLRQVPREADDLAFPPPQTPDYRAVGVPPGFHDPSRVHFPALPPLHGARQPIGRYAGETQRLADVTQR